MKRQTIRPWIAAGALGAILGLAVVLIGALPRGWMVVAGVVSLLPFVAIFVLKA